MFTASSPCKRKTEVLLRHQEVRGHFERIPKLRYRFFLAAAAIKRQSQVVVKHHRQGIDLQGSDMDASSVLLNLHASCPPMRPSVNNHPEISKRT